MSQHLRALYQNPLSNSTLRKFKWKKFDFSLTKTMLTKSKRATTVELLHHHNMLPNETNFKSTESNDKIDRKAKECNGEIVHTTCVQWLVGKSSIMRWTNVSDKENLCIESAFKWNYGLVYRLYSKLIISRGFFDYSIKIFDKNYTAIFPFSSCIAD